MPRSTGAHIAAASLSQRPRSHEARECARGRSWALPPCHPPATRLSSSADIFPEAFRIAAEAQHAARLGVEAVAGAFEDEAPLFDPAYDDRPNANVAAPRQTERLQRKPEKSPLSMTYAHLCHAETAFSDEAAKRRPIKGLVKS